MKIPYPTNDQCSNNEVVFDCNGRIGHAFWTPQAGGYRGKSVAVFDKGWKSYASGSAEGGCIDIYIWHDGEFPYDDEDGREPVEFHICDPEQFITFGEKLKTINNKYCIEL